MCVDHCILAVLNRAWVIHVHSQCVCVYILKKLGTFLWIYVHVDEDNYLCRHLGEPVGELYQYHYQYLYRYW